LPQPLQGNKAGGEKSESVTLMHRIIFGTVLILIIRAVSCNENSLSFSVVERKNLIPVLANILIKSIGDDSIRIYGTDLDVTIRADIWVEELSTQGAICLQAQALRYC
jgi:hypothetical protein